MVVLAASILQKGHGGKILFSRQFVPLPRVRIESLLQSFPKLIGSESQHTFIETEQIRYVYQPLEQLYIVLLTNKQSNIMEDLDTLRLLAKLVPEQCHGISGEHILKHAFELTFAFDEVISLGYKENVTVQQVHTFLEMDSHEEKLQKIITESKMNGAKKQAQERAEEIEKKKQQMREKGMTMQGFGSSSSNDNDDGYDGYPGNHGSAPGGPEYQYDEDRHSSHSSQSAPASHHVEEAPKEQPVITNKKPAKGMSLTVKKKQDDFLTAVKQEDHLTDVVVPEVIPQGGKADVNANRAAEAANNSVATRKGALVSVEEKVSILMERDGGVSKMDVSGQLKLSVFDPDDAKISIATTGPLPANGPTAFKCQLRPGVDKKAWLSEGTLVLTDGKAFALGSENAAVLLKWRRNVKGEDAVPPFTLNFWPNSENGFSTVSAEFTVELGKGAVPAKNVLMTIPCPSSQSPEVSKVDGAYRFDKASKCLYWSIPEISEQNSSGGFEFKIPEVDGESFFPINITFSSDSLVSGLQATAVKRVEGGANVDYAQEISLTTDKFVIE